MDPALREIMVEQAPAGEMEAILKLTKPGNIPSGVRAVAQFGDIATCRLRVGDIQEVWSDEAVLSLKAPREVGNEPAVDDLDITEGVSSRPNPTPFTGKGIVVGIVDWGFDFTHPNFLNPDGSTRFLTLWDQTAPADPSAGKYGYGKMHSQQQINEALTTPKPFDALGYHPASGDPDKSGAHGTHVTDIAAGNGTIGEKGLAPSADLVCVHLSAGKTGGLATLGDSVRILEAIDFIAGVAGERPLVINLSVGKHGGAHQGNSLVEQGMDNFLKEKHGRAIVNSAGNYFSAQIHASGRLMPGGSATLDWEVDKRDRSPNELEIWYPHRDKLRLKIELPGALVPAIELDLGENKDISVHGKIVGRAYHRANEPNTGDNHIDIFLYKNAPKGPWPLTLEGLDVVDGRWHAWVERDSGCRSCQSKFPPHAADPGFTTGSICNGMYTIAVGAYDPRDPERKAALFSSAGPTADGRKKPNLLAPGVGITAARSAAADTPRSNGELTIKSGTSMAAPQVTGAIALLFEAAGQPLPIETTRSLLSSNLEPPPITHGGEEYRYGNGYLHIPSLLEAAARSFSKSFAMKENLLPTLREQSDSNELEAFDVLEKDAALTEEENGFAWQDEEESEEEQNDMELLGLGTEATEMEEENGFPWENEEESGEDEFEVTAFEMEDVSTDEDISMEEEEDYLWESEEEEDETEESHWGQHSDCRECGERLVEQAEAWMQTESAEDFLPGFFTPQPSPAENYVLRRNGAAGARNLYDHYVFGKPMPAAEFWAERFNVVALPKSPLPESLLPGDVVLTRSIGEGKAWEAMALTGEFFTKQQAAAKGCSLDSNKTGVYLEVATVRPVFRHHGEDFVKRVGDEQGRLLADCMVLRAKNPYISTGMPENNIRQRGSKILLEQETDGSPADSLLKFLVHFDRPKIFQDYRYGKKINYAGHFGFDKLRDEYIFPIETVNVDNDGSTAIGTRKPLCKNISTLKATYLKGVTNVIKPYGKDYYPCWFTIFPHTTTAQFSHGSRLHQYGVNLSLELEEIDILSKKDNYILLKSDDPRLTIKPDKITLNTFLNGATKKTKIIDHATGNSKSTWILQDAINIKCKGGTINKHTEIKVFAVGKDKTEQVGQLMAYANNVIPKAEIVLVKVVIDRESVHLRKSMNDHEYILKYQSFNQALIRAEIIVDTEFRIRDLDATDSDVIRFKTLYGGLTTADAGAFLKDIKNLYEKFGRHKPVGGKIDNAKRTYLFITEVQHTGTTTGIADLQSLKLLSKSYTFWQNTCVVFKPALEDNTTFVHEIGHTLSLFHSFEEHSSNAGPRFYHGFTDNAMDYDWKFDRSSNPYTGRRYYFYRWQWDIIRGDKSLITSY
jgi:hypothetical protein